MSIFTVDITTDASGDFSQTFDVPYGLLTQYRYVPDGTNPLATGADLDVVGSNTGFVYINQDNIGTSAFQKVVRTVTSDETGTDNALADGLMMVTEPLTVTIASGGDTDAGTLYFWII